MRHEDLTHRVCKALALLLVLLALSPMAGSPVNLNAAQKTDQARLDGALQELLNRLWSVENFPLGQAQSFSARPEAFYMSLPQSAVSLGEVDSEALLPLGALELQAQGLTGTGVKVAILDQGFVGLKNAIATGELPEGMVTRDFTDSGLEALTNHEIAPDAQLFLVRISDRRTFASAVKWAIAQEVNIINMSVGWFNLDFYDCKGLISDLTTTATQAGVLWVNAAGNQAQTHYEAPFKDEDGDGFHDETIALKADAPTTLTAFLTWDDWSIEDRFSDENFDLFLMQGARQVAASTNIQSASDQASEPKEAINWNVQPKDPGREGEQPPSLGAVCQFRNDQDDAPHAPKQPGRTGQLPERVRGGRGERGRVAAGPRGALQRARPHERGPAQAGLGGQIGGGHPPSARGGRLGHGERGGGQRGHAGSRKFLRQRGVRHERTAPATARGGGPRGAQTGPR